MADIQEVNPASKVVTRRRIVMGAAVAFGGIAMGSTSAWASAEGVSHAAESIQQEPVFKASPKRVYEPLINAKQFDKVIQLSSAMQAGMSLGKQADRDQQGSG